MKYLFPIVIALVLWTGQRVYDHPASAASTRRYPDVIMAKAQKDIWRGAQRSVDVWRAAKPEAPKSDPVPPPPPPPPPAQEVEHKYVWWRFANDAGLYLFDNDTQIGYINPRGVYRPMNGEAWGAACKPPCLLPPGWQPVQEQQVPCST